MMIQFSMPFHRNGSLNSLIESRFLTVREIIQYSLDFLGALHYIHTQQLIHFDVKPTNIIINDANTAILTDFGLSNYVDINGFATVEKVYPTHWTPELYLATKLTSQYDIYQSGLTLYRMCNGNENFKFQSQLVKSPDDIIKARFPNRRSYLPHIPKRLRTVINNALKVDTDKRYKTILDFMNDLSGIDQNLDWRYNQTSGVETWSIENSNTVKSIIKYEKSGKWLTRGENYSKNNQNSTKINKWNSESDDVILCNEKIEKFIEQG
jgi:serine/threonine protein kinase